MTKTIEALDKFTQGLELMAPQPEPRLLPQQPEPAPVQLPLEQATLGSKKAAITTARRPAHSAQSAARAGVVKATESEKSRPAARQSEGVTRKGSRSDWRRLMGLAVTVLAVGLGFTLAVRVGEQVVASCWRQGTRTPLARPLHGSPRPFLAHLALSLRHPVGGLYPPG